MGSYIDRNGQYYEGDQADQHDTPVSQRPSHDYTWTNGVWTLSLQTAQIAQIKKINDAAQAALQALVSSYPAEEVATWPNQYSEAQAYTANPVAPTPTLSAIASGAGLTVSQVVSVVLQKAAAYTASSGAIVGKRKLLTAQILAATTAAQVQGVVW